MAVPGPKPQTHPDRGLVIPMPVATHDYNNPWQQPYGSIERMKAEGCPVPRDTYACDYSKIK